MLGVVFVLFCYSSFGGQRWEDTQGKAWSLVPNDAARPGRGTMARSSPQFCAFPPTFFLQHHPAAGVQPRQQLHLRFPCRKGSSILSSALVSLRQHLKMSLLCLTTVPRRRREVHFASCKHMLRRAIVPNRYLDRCRRDGYGP